MQQNSIDRAPTASEVWAGRALTFAMTLVFGYAAYYTFHAYFVHSAPALGFATFLSCLCAVFLFFFLRSVLTRPGRPTKALLLAVFSVLTVLGVLGLWLAYSVGWPDNMLVIGYAIGILATGIGGLLIHSKRRDA
jgi:multisubunit Na+/H+ antiporter MnhB subunit